MAMEFKRLMVMINILFHVFQVNSVYCHLYKRYSVMRSILKIFQKNSKFWNSHLTMIGRVWWRWWIFVVFLCFIFGGKKKLSENKMLMEIKPISNNITPILNLQSLEQKLWLTKLKKLLSKNPTYSCWFV